YEVTEVRVLEKLEDEQFTRPPLVPPPLTPAFASATNDGRIALRVPMSSYKLTTRPDSKLEYVLQAGEQRLIYNVHEFVKAIDAAGKPLDLKILPDLLKKEKPIVYGYHFDADPPNARFYKDGVLILYLPAPPPTSVPSPAVPVRPANVPVAGLADF